MRFKLGYFLKQAFHGVFRNAVVSTASVLMLVLCMLVLGCFWTILENIDLNISSIDDLNMIVVYLEDDADQLAVNNELNRLPGEPTITYYSKDDNLEKLKETYEEQGFGDLLSFYDSENNPLPASFEITFSDVEKGSTIKYHLSQIDGISDIKDRTEVSERVDDVKHAVTTVSLWLLAILSVVAFFVIVITIRLTIFSRSKEITVMRYIGATNLFITMPFLIEGVIIGLVSAALAFGLQYFLYNYVMLDFLSQYDIISIIPFSEFAPRLIIAFVAIGLFADIFACTVTVRKYLRS